MRYFKLEVADVIKKKIWLRHLIIVILIISTISSPFEVKAQSCSASGLHSLIGPRVGLKEIYGLVVTTNIPSRVSEDSSIGIKISVMNLLPYKVYVPTITVESNLNVLNFKKTSQGDIRQLETYSTVYTVQIPKLKTLGNTENPQTFTYTINAWGVRILADDKRIYPSGAASGAITVYPRKAEKMTDIGKGVTLAVQFPSTIIQGESSIATANVINIAPIDLKGKVTLTYLGKSESKSVSLGMLGSENYRFDVSIPSTTNPGTYVWSVKVSLSVPALKSACDEAVEIANKIPLIGEAAGKLIENAIKKPVEKRTSVSAGGGGTFVVEKKYEEDECLIATAAFGSGMHPKVKAMRSFRNNKVMTTFTGNNFIKIFNAWYYSWSPPVAKLLRGNEDLRLVTRVVLYPLVEAVNIAEGVYDLLSFNRELAAATSILTAAFICGVVYITPIILTLRFTRKRIGLKKPFKVWTYRKQLLMNYHTAALLLTITGLAIHSVELNIIGIATLALAVTLTAALFTLETATRVLTRAREKIKN